MNFNINSFTEFDYAVFAINLLILIISRPIVSGFQEKDPKQISSKLYALRTISLILFILYISALFISDITKQISLTGLTFLVAFILSHLLHLFILKKFGREKDIAGTNYHVETYQSEIFSLLITLVTFIACIVIVIHIWGMTDWLRATSVLGILAIIIFSTKDIWVADYIKGLIRLYNGDIESGALVRIEAHKILAIVVQTTLTQTTFRDLKTRHLIVLPNTTLRNSKIEVLSKGAASGLLHFAYFKIGYETSSAQVKEFLQEVWQRACELHGAINAEMQPEIALVETGDHAVTWRLAYRINKLYQLHEVEVLVQEIAFDIASQSDLNLKTPLTHEVLMKNTSE